MDSTFYDPDSGEGEAQLGVYVHHARGIHNICIYASQDVYAKLSLTCSPDDAVSTRVAAAGGSDPRFDELLTVAVSAPSASASPSPLQSAVLKCEIWMLSRARNLLEDQLLGFALVPLSSVAAAAGRRLTHDFPLSSTELFHSPAGTVRLTLSLDSPPAAGTAPSAAAAASLSSSAAGITSEVVILDPADYRRLEPPDVAAAEENRRMVAEYFDIMSPAPTTTPSLRPAADYYDMTPNSSEKTAAADASSSSSSSSSSSNTSAAEVGTPTSNSAAAAAAESRKLEDDSRRGRKVSVFESPMGSIDVEAEQAAMQQQIVEMYMKSMQQFTESLAKMALPPMGLDNPRPDDRGVVIQTQNNNNNNNNNNDNKLDAEEKNKKTKNDGSRVFYGSRAFF